MTSISHIPKPLGGDPPQVVERKIKEVECPNPKCDQALNVTNLNAGTKIQCEKCNNVTWVPAYEPKWWQKAWFVILSLLLSFIIGVLGSLTAQSIWETFFLKKPIPVMEGNTDPSVGKQGSNKANSTDAKNSAAD